MTALPSLRSRTLAARKVNLSTWVLAVFLVALVLPWVVFVQLTLDGRTEGLARARQNLGAAATAYAEHAAALVRLGVATERREQELATFRNAVGSTGMRFSLEYLRPTAAGSPGRASNAPLVARQDDITVRTVRPSAGVAVIAAVSEAIALKNWRQRTRVQAIALLLRSLFVIAVGAFLVHQLRAKEKLQLELMAARETAEIASRAKSDLLANTSHELRTPLNAIIGFSDIIKRGMFGPVNAKYREYAGDIYNSGTHLLGVINDILDLSKLEAGQLSLDDDTVDLSLAVRECVRLIEAQAQKAQVALVLQVPDETSPVRGDDRRLRQILINLLSNAVKFTPDGGRVTVSVAMEGLGFSVRDTGIGMRPEQITKALEPFGQIDSKLSRKYQGTGLGLPIAKHLVELHGGTLSIQSEENVGTSITVALPAERKLTMPMRLSAAAAG